MENQTKAEGMTTTGNEAEWYYVGQYGEIGPLTADQMGDLVQDKVVDRDTYVWRKGMTNWVMAAQVAELSDRLREEVILAPPPLPPARNTRPVREGGAAFASGGVTTSRVGTDMTDWRKLEATLPISDKSRTTAGLLNFVPGAGRLYLGYSAHGVLQIIATVACGFGLIWAWIDAILILSGSIKFDGFGRVLRD